MFARSTVLTAVLLSTTALAQQNSTPNSNQIRQTNQPPRAPGQMSNANAEPTPQPLGTPGLIAEPTYGNGSTTGDQQFIMNIALRGMREITLAKLALEKSSSPAIKEYATKALEEQTKATGALKRIGGKQSIAIPDSLDPKEQGEVDRIAKLSHENFDRAYSRDLVRTHERSLREFQREAKEGQDEQVKQFAARVLPLVERHLQSAKDLAKQPVVSQK